MIEQLSVRSLRMLEAAVRNGSFQAAAVELNCVPSAVSNRIRQLSDAFGVTLFSPNGRGVAPTQEAYRLAAYASEVLTQLDRAQSELLGAGADGKSFSIGLADAACGPLLGPVLVALRAERPGLRVRVETGHTVPMIEQVKRGGLDAAIICGDTEDAALMIEAQRPDRLVIAAPKDVSASGELAGLPAFLFACPCTYRGRFVQWLRRVELDVPPVYELSSIEAMLNAVADGGGFTIAPKSSLERFGRLEDLSLFDLPAPIGGLPLSLVRSTARQTSPAVPVVARVVMNHGSHEGAEAELTAAE